MLSIGNFFSPSAHGTFLGSIRLEGHKPQQIPLDSTIHFGASTRCYVLREKPQTASSVAATDSKSEQEEDEIIGGLLGLPEEETELEVCVFFISLSYCFLCITKILQNTLVNGLNLGRNMRLLKGFV